MKTMIFVLSINMYRVSCLCAKTEFYRIKIVPTWVDRKCNKCKSNFIIYNNDNLVINYNNKKERALNRPIRKRKVIKKQSPVQVPVSFQNVFISFPEITNPVKNDVFMGYQGSLDIRQTGIDVGVQTVETVVEMESDVDLFESELFEFEFESAS